MVNAIFAVASGALRIDAVGSGAHILTWQKESDAREAG